VRLPIGWLAEVRGFFVLSALRWAIFGKVCGVLYPLVELPWCYLLVCVQRYGAWWWSASGGVAYVGEDCRRRACSLARSLGELRPDTVAVQFLSRICVVVVIAMLIARSPGGSFFGSLFGCAVEFL
jgi:hypothetical protein